MLGALEAASEEYLYLYTAKVAKNKALALEQRQASFDSANSEHKTRTTASYSNSVSAYDAKEHVRVKALCKNYCVWKRYQRTGQLPT
jgi:hypothetical protein